MAIDDDGDPLSELRMINERLLLAGLRQHERAEEVEHERREKATLLESVNIGIVAFDDALRCTWINRAAAQMLAIGTASALGWDIRGMLQGGQMEQRLECVKLAVREVAHLVNNDLALADGTLDLLRGNRGLSAEALENVHTALAAIDTAVKHLRKFQRVVRVETQESPIGLTLDVERSI